jgi:hypothetical protein
MYLKRSSSNGGGLRWKVGARSWVQARLFVRAVIVLRVTRRLSRLAAVVVRGTDRHRGRRRRAGIRRSKASSSLVAF